MQPSIPLRAPLGVHERYESSNLRKRSRRIMLQPTRLGSSPSSANCSIVARVCLEKALRHKIRPHLPSRMVDLGRIATLQQLA